MKGLSITAGGWLRTIDLDPQRVAATIGCRTADRKALHHNVDLWHDKHYPDNGRQPNMAAVCLLLSCSNFTPTTVPIICGDVLLLGLDPRGNTVDLSNDQYHVLGYALLSSLAA